VSLLSDENGWISAQSIEVSGGYLIELHHLLRYVAFRFFTPTADVAKIFQKFSPTISSLFFQSASALFGSSA
jgi:hypothetical protein